MTAQEIAATAKGNVDVLTVALGERAYDIVIGDRLLSSAGWRLRPLLPQPRTITVSDANVAAHHLAALEASLRDAAIKNASIVLPAGEATKSFAQFESLVDQLIDAGVDRQTTLIALGGGVIGDIVGFAASVILRGVPFIQIPTTLLAQVDSSVGGKTGINTSRGKNLVGTFHQPLMVLVDVATLDTLPRREVLAGYAETVKYALIEDAEFFDWLNIHGAAVRDGGRTERRYAIHEACQGKARIVGEDERESGSGRRVLLNLGHTFAHMLEAQSGFGSRLLHGEAVAIGIVLAFELSARLGYCVPADVAAVRHHLSARGLPVDLSGLVDDGWTEDALMAHMRRDKKASGGRLTFVLVGGIGQAFATWDVPEAALRTLLKDALAAGRGGAG